MNDKNNEKIKAQLESNLLEMEKESFFTIKILQKKLGISLTRKEQDILQRTFSLLSLMENEGVISKPVMAKIVTRATQIGSIYSNMKKPIPQEPFNKPKND